MKSKVLFLSLPVLLSACTSSQDSMKLSGNWRFSTDGTKWDQTIVLPGSMASNGLGDDISVSTPWTGGIVDSSFFKSEHYARYRVDGHVKVPFWLQPVKYYKGVAWYEKEVILPDSWDGKDIQLFLERCHWETRLWVDGREIGMRNALGAPHRYDLTGILSPGKHTLLLQVDNTVKDIDPGENSHSISDHTQGNWNGIIGEISLRMKPRLNISRADIYPDADNHSVTVKTVVMNRKDKNSEAVISMKVGKDRMEKSVRLKPGMNELEMTLRMTGRMKKWDEFNPNLYKLEMMIKDNEDKSRHIWTEKFGFRDFRVTDGKLTINGRRVFLRGTLDCAAYPLTGYPPTDRESWKKVFSACKAHGLNHVRFHSWCPPEAAFDVADEMGLYLEIECSSWANQSVTLGDGLPVDRFIYEESKRIVTEFGNHPSFCMMMYGNEPGGAKSHRYLSDFVSGWKETDDRRLYCSSAGWPNLPESDFLNDAAPRIQAWGQGVNSIINAQPPRTDYDWSGYTGRFSQPMISHEIGQWCAYPNFREMKKYDGVMKPKNFEIFRETLEKNGMGHLADSFLMASGKLQALCYKADIEAALRTKDFGGFQLLGLSDFPGQGTALVGVLDVFWEQKGYVSPDEFRRFCNTTVPLVRLPRLIYTNNEELVADVEVAHFGPSVLRENKTSWELKTSEGRIVASGELHHDEITVGNGFQLGQIRTKLDKIREATQMTLEVRVGRFVNSWHVWCYPADVSHESVGKDILLTDRLDENAIRKLDQGGKVLLSLRKGTLSPKMGGSIQVGFSSIFWNTAWTLGQAPHTLGILCDPKHPAFNHFPTSYYSDYQWWDAMSHSNVVDLSEFSVDVTPIIRVIDDWFTNRPLALVFEVKVGNGSLLVSGIDFWQDMENRKEARQLLYSLMDYMSSTAFHPQVRLTPVQLQKLNPDR